MSDIGELPIKDSGERRVFKTGAMRDRAFGKGLPSLISPIFLTRLSKHLEKGAEKYSSRNWEKGMFLGDFIDSALRHLIAIMEGKDDEDNEAALAFNIMGFMHTKEMIQRGLLPKELDNMPSYVSKEMIGLVKNTFAVDKYGFQYVPPKSSKSVEGDII